MAVTAGSGCAWTAQVDSGGAGWLTITAGGSGSGSGTVVYSVAANSSVSARTGTLTISPGMFWRGRPEFSSFVLLERGRVSCSAATAATAASSNPTAASTRSPKRSSPGVQRRGAAAALPPRGRHLRRALLHVLRGEPDPHLARPPRRMALPLRARVAGASRHAAASKEGSTLHPLRGTQPLPHPRTQPPRVMLTEALHVFLRDTLVIFKHQVLTPVRAAGPTPTS